MLDRHTGKLIASRTADRFGLVQYLVGAGEHLAAVGGTRVATVRFDEFESGPIRLTHKFDQPGIRGRVVPAGGLLYVPTLGGLVQIDPADPRESTRFIALDHPGEALPVGEQVVVVDDAAVHTYVSWAVADRVLLERMRAEPDQAAPAVSYADLAYRVGRADRIVPAVDRALEALARRPSDASNIAARSRLFKALHTMATDALGSPGGGGDSPVLDDATLRDVVDRLGRVAATSEQRVEYLLVLGPAFESAGEHSAASEAYGRILADAALGDVELVSDGRRDQARAVATLRLRALALEHGVEAYAGENARAAAALEKLGPRADPAVFEALARRYPVSESASRAWLAAGEAHLSEGRVGVALLAFRRSLLAAEIALAAGLADDTSAVAVAADRIVATLRDQERHAEAAQILARLMAEHADSPILAGQTDASAVLADLTRLAAATDRRPRIGSTLTGSAQAIPGWTLVPTLMDAREGGVGHVLLRSTAAREIALFGPVEAVRGLGERAMNADGPGRLAKLWTRTFTDFDPGVIRVDDDSVYLLWPTPRGGDIERISVIDGRTLWRTGAFDALFKPDGSFANRLTNRLRLPIMFDTPGGVRRAAAELVVWVGPDAVVVVERSGRMAVFDPKTGTVVRTMMTPVAAVFDVHVASGLVALAGSKSPPNPDTGRVDVEPIVAVFDARTGERIGTSAVVSAQPAWVRIADPDTLVVGTSGGLQCIDVPTGRTRWSHAGDVPGTATDGTMAAWVFGPVLYTRGRSGEIVARSMTDGRVIGTGP
ncbi:MAG: PQQ-binding-like beta-propeller repeat protein, partial [Planctomycetes bacterium]|nr:PQQ-binding-like beta-propeller repeat protein [Planctomycetota bacterium]